MASSRRGILSFYINRAKESLGEMQTLEKYLGGYDCLKKVIEQLEKQVLAIEREALLLKERDRRMTEGIARARSELMLGHPHNAETILRGII